MENTSSKLNSKTWTGITWPTHRKKAAQRKAFKRSIQRAGKK